MRILPKIGENEERMHPDLLDKINESKGCEIQLLTDIPDIAFSNAMKSLEKFNLNIDYIIVHVPFSMIMLDMVYRNDNYRYHYVKFINRVLDYSETNKVRIDIVTHVNPSYSQFNALGTEDFLMGILAAINRSRVRLLIENSIISLNEDDNAESTEEAIFRQIRHPHLKFCLDLCHLQASENVLQKSRCLTQGLLENISNIHFSATLDNDGYRNKKSTHGRAHRCLDDVLNDLRYLQNKGIDIEGVNIVLEINEDDYVNRPDLLREIHYFNEINTYRLI